MHTPRLDRSASQPMVRLRVHAGIALVVSAALSIAACEDIRLPAIVVDGGAGGDGGSSATSTATHTETSTATCPEEKERCDGKCIDPEIDNQHCGGCDHPCTGGASCVLGDCRCPAGEERCEDRCVLLDVDPAHCGECGHPCKSGICVAGECE